MSSQFIGLTVFITLKDAENTQLRGIVADVVMSGQDNELDLTNGWPHRFLQLEQHADIQM